MTLSLKTQMEQARGVMASGKAVNMDEALVYVKELQVLADGERELRALANDREWELAVLRPHPNGTVIVTITASTRQAPPGVSPKPAVTLSDPFKGFPSDKLKAQVMLVAG
jgi:hypothetical protein